MPARPFPLPRAVMALGVAGLLLTGCKIRAHDGDDNMTASISLDSGDNATVGAETGNGARSLSINVPGFSARMKVPDLALGSDTTHIDNLRIFPGTSIHGVNVHGDAGGEGDVEMAFTAPADSAKILAWYRDEAQKEGWTIDAPTGGNQFEATRTEEGHGPTHLAIRIGADGQGSSGRFLVTGH